MDDDMANNKSLVTGRHQTSLPGLTWQVIVSKTSLTKIKPSFRGARSANPESRDSGSGPSDHPRMTRPINMGDADYDAARKSQFDENAFCRVERRDVHRSREGSRGGADAGSAGSLHPRTYHSSRRDHVPGGVGRRRRGRYQFA